MATTSQSTSLTEFEVQLLQKIQDKSSPLLDFVALAIHRTVRDDIVVFSAPTAYFLVADPQFGLSLLVTLCLTELINGIIKLYSIRPRPLWVSTSLRRNGSVWEKDSSFPSSHAQSIATLFSFLLLRGKDYLPDNAWFYASLVTGGFTLLAGLSRAYLAMHFVSDVIAGWVLGFLVALITIRLNIVETFVRVPVPWAVCLSLFSTTYLLGCLFLAAHLGEMDTDQRTLNKWLQTALRNSTKAPGSDEGKERESMEGKATERINPHEVGSYMTLVGAFLSLTLFPALLSLRHPHHPRSPKHTPLTLYRPYTTTSTEPSLSFWVVGALGLLVLDVLKSAVANKRRRESWPVWKQAAFYSAFSAASVAWVLAGAGIAHRTNINELFRSYGGAGGPDGIIW